MGDKKKWESTTQSYGPNGPPEYTTDFNPSKGRPSQLTSQMTIVEIYPKVMSETPDDIDAAAAGWTTLARQLKSMSTQLRDNYDKVAADWTSDAGGMFTAYVSDYLTSVDDWHQAAVSNGPALTSLATSIRNLQNKMTQMWNSFDQDIQKAEAEKHQSHAIWHGVGQWAHELKLGWKGETELDPVLEDYTNRVKTEIVEPMNKAFSDAFLSVHPGMKLGGPSNGPSMKDVTTAMQRLMMSQLPGGGRGPMPTAPAVAPPGAQPTMPPAPVMPPVGTLPVAPPPVAPPVAPRAVAPPPQPVAPPAPIAPPAPVAPPAPIAPPAPVGPPAPIAPSLNLAPPQLPGLGGAPLPPGGLPPGALPPGTLPPGLGRGAPPTAPGLGGENGLPPGGQGGLPGQAPGNRPGAPGMPRGLQGRGGMSEPEMPPSSSLRPPPPQLSGRGGPGGGNKRPGRPGTPRGSGNEEPEMPPGGRGGPALPGRNGKNGKPDPYKRSGRPGGPPGDDIPESPSRMGTPRNLQGIRDKRPRWRPGSLESEEIPMRTLPTLNGRLGPGSADVQESLESAEQALRPGLGGRGVGRGVGRPAQAPDEPEMTRPAASAPKKRRPESEEERARPAVDFVGDSDLFTPKDAAPAVIERPEEAKPVVAGKPALRPAAPVDHGSV